MVLRGPPAVVLDASVPFDASAEDAACSMAPAAYPELGLCSPGALGSLDCPGQTGATGWWYSCTTDWDAGPDASLAAHFSQPAAAAGPCIGAYTRTTAGDAGFLSMLCPIPTCSRNTSYDRECSGKHAFACPLPDFDAGVEPPSPTCTLGPLWNDGDTYGPIYCCP